MLLGYVQAFLNRSWTTISALHQTIKNIRTHNIKWVYYYYYNTIDTQHIVVYIVFP